MKAARVLGLLAVLGLAGLAQAVDPGVLPLDKYTFDKVVDGHRPVLVRFEKEYPYGAKADAFKTFAENVGQGGVDLIVAEVGVQTWGDKKNSDLAARFGAEDEKTWPQIRLFKKGGAASAPLTFKYSGDFTDEELVRFVKNEAGIYMGLQGTLEAMEAAVEEFAAAAGGSKGKAAREAALARAEKQAQGYAEGTADAEAAKYYVKTMRKTIEKEDHPEVELARIAKVKEAARQEKKAEFEKKQNVLSSFIAAAKKSSKK